MFENPFQQKAREFLDRQEPPESVTAPDFQVDAMPNSEKLTSVERWIYKKLPGFSESTAGKALANFGESPLGKALSVLDIGAEGLERSLGFLKQYADRDPNEDFDFKAAWYAGSLTADVANLPTFVRDDEGNIAGLEITEDLPGVASLVHARKQIAELVNQGVSYKDALAQTRDGYYNNLGALQLRAQINDTWLHVLGDPFNYVMPALKPIERLHAVRHLALANKIPLDEVQDMLKVAKAAGNTEEAARLSGIIADVEKGALKPLSTWDKFAIMATGGNPLKGGDELGFWGKLGRSKLNPAALTPQSRAQEMVTMVSDHIGSYVIAKHMDDPKAIRDAIMRASKGALGQEYGHAFISLEGRMAQGQLGAIAAHTDDLYKAYNITNDERAFLNMISDALGDNSTRVLREMAENPEVMLKRLTGIQNETIQALLQTGELNANRLGEIAKIMENVPHTPELFALELMAKVEDITMQQSILRFGVEARGLVTRWSGALKAAESFAFLRLNPGYAVRNVINNDLTMFARGVFGTMLPDQIDNFWKAEGWLPQRLAQGFGAAGPDIKISSKSGQMLDEALRAGNYGAPEKIQDFFRNIELGKVDATYWGSKLEETASKRAFTTGYIQGIREHFWKPGKNFDRIQDVLRPSQVDELRKIDPRLPEVIESVVESSGAREAAIDAGLKANARYDYASAARDVEERLGMNLDDVLGPELTETIARGMPEAAANGKLDEFVLGMRTKLEQHLDDMHQKEMAELPGLIAEKVKAGGPQMFYKTIGDATDNFWSAHSEHAIRMTQITDSAQAAARSGDFERAGAIWDKIMRDEDKFFGRMWDRFDGSLKGLEKGAKEAGIPFSGEIKNGYKNIRNTWKDFFEYRQAGYKKLRASKNWKADYDAFKSDLDVRYKQAIDVEDNAVRMIDDAVADGIDNEAVRSSFTKWREYVADLRRQDKEDTAKFMQDVRMLEPEERKPAFDLFWKKRQENFTELWRADRIGNQMMAGDGEALAFVDGLPVKPGVQGEGANKIRSIADEYGIASATEAGAPNDRHIVNIVNKFFGVEDKKIPLGKVKELPRGQLPQHTSERFAQEARRMISDMFGGQPGKRATAADQLGEGATEAFGTTNVGWYRDLPANLQKKDVLDKALSKIVEDAGKDKGVNVERMKDFILDRFTYGDKELGQPPDLGVLMELGAPKKTMQEALDAFNEITGQKLSLNEALKVSGWRKGGFKTIDEIPEELARAAFEARAAEKGLPAQSQTFIGDISKIFPDQIPLAQGLDNLTFGRSYAALDELAESMRASGKQTPLIIDQLPKQTREAVESYLNKVKGQASDARYAATRFAEFRRDSALLNYNRRTNFDSWVSNVFPFAFWTTGSVQMWALHSIDRPAMLTNTLRAKKFLETSGAPGQPVPTRLKGKIRVKLPFTPDWMGDQFIDPIGMALPFDQWAMPLEQLQKSQTTLDGRADRLLDEMLSSGQISQKEYNEAKAHQGPMWEQVKAQALQNDEDLKFDAFDFTSLISSPHAPLMWAYNAARGHPEDTGPFMPFSRTARNVATTLGIEDWQNSPLNMEAKLRKSMGLPAYDKWDDYRTDRMLSNMAATGEFTLKEVQDAMFLSSQVQAGQITPEQAKEQSEAYREAIKKMNIEFSGGGIAGTLLKALGIPVQGYPTGEKMQRSLADDFGRAYEAYKNGNIDALNGFFEKHPEYESRLALYDKPEERMRKFMVDELWSRYNELPKITRKEIAEQIGGDFQNAFLSSETRSYDSLSIDQMQIWLKLMGGENPGVLSAESRLVYQLFGNLQLTDPETAERGQVFYDMRDNMFPDYYEMQNEYYALPEGQPRKDYLRKEPELKMYWDWRRDFMNKNPDLVPYLTDNQKLVEEAREKSRPSRNEDGGPVPTAQEIAQNFSPSAKALLEDYANGEDMPYAMQSQIDYIAQMYGLTPDQVMNILIPRQ